MTAQPEHEHEILLEAIDLEVRPAPRAPLAVRGVSFRLRRGGTLAILGGAGCGKSLLGQAVLRLLPPDASAAGQLIFLGRDLLRVPDDELRFMRGQHVGFVASDPRAMFNPGEPIGWQVAESLRVHRGLGEAGAITAARDALLRAGVTDPDLCSRSYARQRPDVELARAALAAAAVCQPALLVLDDPTRQLPAEQRDAIIDTIRSIRAASRAAVLLLARDSVVAMELADEMQVMHDGHFATPQRTPTR